ncbi:hypothetical protein JR316_0012720 [Psilocybe cubensis]|uniref:Uncharacterized protein n=2 Tax=Psilocybe cubensis TaxID=181762 RepID=A0ACB8GJ98_PSICU|nr:hypothetical protein JR316_0012720 [Psilocybe cubensis]KAH9475603.1 hypothetical protein JR316_0012720 [Psilocybe cubensis]
MTEITFASIDIASDFRALNFISSDLGEHVYLLLVFDAPNGGTLYKDLFPVCWTCFSPTFPLDEHRKPGLRLKRTKMPGSIGQICTLKTNDSNGQNYLTSPEEGDPDVIQCRMMTATAADLGVGLITKAGTKIEPLFLWNDIGRTSTLAIKLKPMLKIYAVSDATDFVGGKLIKSAFRTAPVLEINLISLTTFTEWQVYINPSTKAIEIKQID